MSIGTEDETTADKLRSILAQMEYTYTVRKWDAQGVPFKSHIYVPEVHPITGSVFHEREDEGHVLKVIITIAILNCTCHLPLFFVYVKCKWSILVTDV